MSVFLPTNTPDTQTPFTYAEFLHPPSRIIAFAIAVRKGSIELPQTSPADVHVFCVECSRRHGLTGQAPDRRKLCPACECQLNNPDDAVVTNLNLTEDYKTSVLSGLSPNIIMECTGRALSFWAYQTTQEVIYQRYLEKTLTEKLKTLNKKFEKTVGDANTDILGLQEKIRDDYDDMRRKHEELAHSYQDKCRKLTQVQELYDKVKRKAELGQMEAAASDAVDSNLHGRILHTVMRIPTSGRTEGISEGLLAEEALGHYGKTEFGQSLGLRKFNVQALLPQHLIICSILDTSDGSRTQYGVMSRSGQTWSTQRPSPTTWSTRGGGQCYSGTGQESPKTMPKKRKTLQKPKRPGAKSDEKDKRFGVKWLQAAAHKLVHWWRQRRGGRNLAERRERPRLTMSSPVHFISNQTAGGYSAVPVLPEPGSVAIDASKLGLQWEALGAHPIWRTGESEDGR
ncbi:hypothetical protein CORC01_03181 [Colletotrichum orchidophilum]|uniref:E3 ubiquitin-protein ligase CCNB1IP1 n=1 Tax=Colletotrichum orchidophilum TaxID=1209926 RepID=A0A1G4BJ67_9PEZI|nr:uncharacterized protein CORC01_03181 [Colletotrichum orchidophilum]OHF01425.1 hypothetical protein CORC01_03181 [Colletotrichum orchidophilum]